MKQDYYKSDYSKKQWYAMLIATGKGEKYRMTWAEHIHNTIARAAEKY